MAGSVDLSMADLSKPCSKGYVPCLLAVNGTVVMLIWSSSCHSTSMVLQVYKARLDGISDVAVKFLNSQAQNAKARDAFEKEVAILGACRNQNVVMFLGAFQHQVCNLRSCKPRPSTQMLCKDY